MSALIHCGASLTDLKEWWQGNLDEGLVKLVTTYYLANGMYNNYRNDAIENEKAHRLEVAKVKGNKS